MGVVSSDGVLESESNLEDLLIEEFDLLAQLGKLLVFALSAGGVIVFAAVVRQLKDLELVVVVASDLSLLLQALDLARTHLEAVRRDAGLLLCCCCLHILFSSL